MVKKVLVVSGVTIDMHKILPLNTHNQIFIKSEVFVGHVFDTLEQFFPTNWYNEIDWLLFTALEKVMKRKDDFRGNLFLTEFPTLAHYQVTQEAVALSGAQSKRRFYHFTR